MLEPRTVRKCYKCKEWALVCSFLDNRNTMALGESNYAPGALNLSSVGRLTEQGQNVKLFPDYATANKSGLEVARALRTGGL